MASILVTGASGFVGSRLVPALLDTGHDVRVLTRDPDRLDPDWVRRVDVTVGDLLAPEDLARALDGVGTAYYLVHGLANGSLDGLLDREETMAARFRDAAAAGGVERIVYLGGIVDDDVSLLDLSTHLYTRVRVGQILADGAVPTVELRAAVILGPGSASYRMLVSAASVPAVSLDASFTRSRCQPIHIDDVLHYLTAVLDCPPVDAIHEIGGADVLTYRDMVETYREVVGRWRGVGARLPGLTPERAAPAAWLLSGVEPAVALSLLQSSVHDAVVHRRPIDGLVEHEPAGFVEAVERIERVT